jgi:pimeloyl-ACP methyl ester carboxylesterase
VPAATLSLFLSGCGLGSLGGESEEEPSPTMSARPLDPPSEEATPVPRDELGRYYAQELDWGDCGEDMRCAELEVPLDYADPDGRSIALSLLQVPATGDRRVGSLVVNPGGPGRSGVDYASQAEYAFGPEIRHAFDVVGFDPRGVGRSTPLQCLADAELDVFVASDPDPDTARERRETNRLLAAFGDGCLEESGELTAHVSTAEVARDMDVLRAVLGDRRLSYFGASYGTFIGATYAELFPQHVGRMVLDGAVDPSLTTEELNLVQAKGFEVALRAYVDHCVKAGDCFLGDSVDDGTARVRAFLDAVDDQPLETEEQRRLTEGHAVLGIWAPLYSEGSWPVLDSALRAAFAGDGSKLLSLSDGYIHRDADGYFDNSLEALYAVNCLDHPDAISVSQVPERIPEFEEASATFGSIFAFGLASCARWPVDSESNPVSITAEGAAPILVVGTTRDPATPLVWAEALAAQLESGVLVRRDGDGHTGYRAGNACVDKVVESYLVQGVVPGKDVDC